MIRRGDILKSVFRPSMYVGVNHRSITLQRPLTPVTHWEPKSLPDTNLLTEHI